MRRLGTAFGILFLFRFILPIQGQNLAVTAPIVAPGLAKVAPAEPDSGEKEYCGTASKEADVVWDDRCSDFQIVAGIEEAGAGSLPPQTNFFLSGFTRVSGTKDAGLFPVRPWARIRILGAPTGSTGDVITAFQDPSGALKDLPKSKIGQSVDFVAGVEVPMWGRENKRYSGAFILDGGGTSPLTSDNVVSKFQVPAAGSQQCNLILQKFTASNGYPAGLIQANTDPTTPTNCLAHGYTVLAFSNEDRSSVLRKYAFGLRTTFRYANKNVKTTDTTPEDLKAENDSHGAKAKTTNETTTNWTCCQSGIVDWTLGQDEATTGGSLRHWVFRIDGVYPLYFGKDKDAGWLYVFGTFAVRLQRNKSFPSLILKSDTSSAVPSDPNVLLLPLKQPDRDFFRFGVAVGIDKLFSKLATK